MTKCIVMTITTHRKHNKNDMSSSLRAPRIGIVGAGIGGLSLAGILSRKLPHAKLSVFERASKDRDEGYGLDLDEWGQEALVRAGVFDKFWSVSRPRSDIMRTYPLRGRTPIFTKFSPSLEAESNRAAMRCLFIDAMGQRGQHVQHGVHIADARMARGGCDALSSTAHVSRQTQILLLLLLIIVMMMMHSYGLDPPPQHHHNTAHSLFPGTAGLVSDTPVSHSACIVVQPTLTCGHTPRRCPARPVQTMTMTMTMTMAPRSSSCPTAARRSANSMS